MSTKKSSPINKFLNKKIRPLPGALILFFLFIFLFQVSLLTGSVAIGQDVYAATFLPGYDPASGLPGYISALYSYSLGIIGILATVVMMYGGLIWITAGGNQQRSKDALDWISAAISGLILALASYMLLYAVSPDLLKNKMPTDLTPINAPADVNGSNANTNNPVQPVCSTIPGRPELCSDLKPK
ncbi:MAG: hypothetical protein NT091_00940 [Candidatus Falkowbacteria bacterium]|nr:hypothetical protein [Candidatus Falkowbacteria bacterium]